MPGFAGEPLVGVARGLVEARTHVHEPRRAARVLRGVARRGDLRARARPARGRCERLSEPKSITKSVSERSKIGTDATPNTVSVAWRSASGANGS